MRITPMNQLAVAIALLFLSLFMTTLMGCEALLQNKSLYELQHGDDPYYDQQGNRLREQQLNFERSQQEFWRRTQEFDNRLRYGP